MIANVSNNRRVLLKGDSSESFVIRLLAISIKGVVRISLRVEVGKIRSIEIRVFLRLRVALRVVHKGLRKWYSLSIQLIRLAKRGIESVRGVKRLRTKVEKRVNRAK